MEFQPQIPPTQKKVYNFVKNNSGVSNREIAEGTGLDLSCVCGRVNELVNDLKLLKTLEKSPCKITGKTVYKWAVR